MRTIWIALALCGLLVAFLMVSFFVLSTTLIKPSTMTLNVPDGNRTEQSVDTRKTLMLYLDDKQTYLLDRISPEAANAGKALVAVPTDSLSATIQRMKQQAETSIGKDSLVLIIKPLPTSSYKTMVNALDVLAILKIKKYALVDALTPTERRLLVDKKVCLSPPPLFQRRHGIPNSAHSLDESFVGRGGGDTDAVGSAET